MFLFLPSFAISFSNDSPQAETSAAVRFLKKKKSLLLQFSDKFFDWRTSHFPLLSLSLSLSLCLCLSLSYTPSHTLSIPFASSLLPLLSSYHILFPSLSFSLSLSVNIFDILRCQKLFLSLRSTSVSLSSSSYFLDSLFILSLLLLSLLPPTLSQNIFLSGIPTPARTNSKSFSVNFEQEYTSKIFFSLETRR